jgi:hypothetical protein
MGQFVNIYQLSTWLDTYAHLLTNLDACNNARRTPAGLEADRSARAHR